MQPTHLCSIARFGRIGARPSAALSDADQSRLAYVLTKNLKRDRAAFAHGGRKHEVKLVDPDQTWSTGRPIGCRTCTGKIVQWRRSDGRSRERLRGGGRTVRGRVVDSAGSRSIDGNEVPDEALLAGELSETLPSVFTFKTSAGPQPLPS